MTERAILARRLFWGCRIYSPLPGRPHHPGRLYRRRRAQCDLS